MCEDRGVNNATTSYVPPTPGDEVKYEVDEETGAATPREKSGGSETWSSRARLYAGTARSLIASHGAHAGTLMRRMTTREWWGERRSEYSWMCKKDEWLKPGRRRYLGAIIFAFLVIIIVAATVPAVNHPSHGEAPDIPLDVTCETSTDRPGKYDYYVLSLSWSPQYCSTSGRNDRQQCGASKGYGMVLHGLWPQFSTGGWPQYCATTEPLYSGVVDRMDSIMPSDSLIEHEWCRHGTCTGMTSRQYFKEAHDAFSAVVLPYHLRRPREAESLTPQRITQELLAANPDFPPQSVVVLCQGGFLSEIHVCMSKDLTAQPCGQDVMKDACTDSLITISPVPNRRSHRSL